MLVELITTPEEFTDRLLKDEIPLKGFSEVFHNRIQKALKRANIPRDQSVKIQVFYNYGSTVLCGILDSKDTPLILIKDKGEPFRCDFETRESISLTSCPDYLRL